MNRSLLAGVTALALLAPFTSGHGATITESKDVGPYHVMFFGYDLIQEGEQVRVGWNVTDRATGERVPLEGPVLHVSFRDTSGKLVKATNVSVEQPVPGIVFADVTMLKFGSATYTLPLPEGGNVSFEQPICRFDDAGIIHCPNDAKGSPGLGEFGAAAALGAAAVGLRSRRR
jgi:hypothetical protein